MDSSDEQQPELPAQQPAFPLERPTSLPTITVAELEQQCQDLRTLLTATCVALLVLSLSLNLFLVKQMRLVRAKVSESRPTIQRLQTQFKEKEPNMKNFVVALQTFAAANRDFQPVLDKYRYDLPQYIAPPAASTAPPGVRVPVAAATSAPAIQPVRPAAKWIARAQRSAVAPTPHAVSCLMKPAAAIAGLALPFVLAGCHPAREAADSIHPMPVTDSLQPERQITRARHGHVLTNTGVWSPDGEWIAYDTRSDAAGDVFDGRRIEMVHVRTAEVRVLYESRDGAYCGVVTFHPRELKVAFILGPENPTPDWSYNAYHRQGVVVDTAKPGVARNLDARDLTPPFTPGALRGGSHVHVWDAAGEWVSFTYEDHILAQFNEPGPDHEMNLRNVGVSVPARSVRASQDHPRNHDGNYFSALATRTTARPKPGSDEIMKAFEEGWIGTNGYVNSEGKHQRRALAFQGNVVTERNEIISEVFVADLPEDITQVGEGPLAGTETQMPRPPKGTSQRRLTFTAQCKFPGLQGPRHWLRSSPDGSRIAFLMRDDAGIAQLWTVSPNGGAPRQVTRNPWSVASAFSWSPDGKHIACVMDNSVFLIDGQSGLCTRLTSRSADDLAPRPEACVFSPNGRAIAYVRRVLADDGVFNQVFAVFIK